MCVCVCVCVYVCVCAVYASAHTPWRPPLDLPVVSRPTSRLADAAFCYQGPTFCCFNPYFAPTRCVRHAKYCAYMEKSGCVALVSHGVVLANQLLANFSKPIKLQDFKRVSRASDINLETFAFPHTYLCMPKSCSGKAKLSNNISTGNNF